ncbi:ROK family protein [Planctobacterium marinum]|uniref:ROK family protein n=1 Tax=Planctobacterium marinum TaxID=1631968 RepID=UPI001E3AB6C3|nr:ROK family protein [Planctobacterium marinum]MCC2606881.1 ROK family protein [Planctobacterium marinum]
MTEYFAVIEAGGTKFNCAIIDKHRDIAASIRIPTTTPEQTLSACVDFFNEQKQAGLSFSRMGIAAFGPLDLKPDSPTFGYITATPKPHWSNTPLSQVLSEALNCKVTLDTDVNAAALAEYRWGAAQDCEVVVYVTIGTGIGSGIVINGKPIHGLIHAEAGHMIIGEIDGIKGVCPFHGSCVSGLASGYAMSQIWQQPAETLPDDHRAWQIQAQVLGTFCHNLLLNYSPHKIVLGGGVMHKPGLLEDVRKYTESSLNQYLTLPHGVQFGDLICQPGLGDKSGLYGALALLQQ